LLGVVAHAGIPATQETRMRSSQSEAGLWQKQDFIKTKQNKKNEAKRAESVAEVVKCLRKKYI
jgi:hypothetical protein